VLAPICVEKFQQQTDAAARPVAFNKSLSWESWDRRSLIEKGGWATFPGTENDKATGKEQQIRIQASGGLSEADIQRMVREAEQHSADDKRRRELIEARNQADALIYGAEKDLKEGGNQPSDTDRHTIEEAIAALRAAMAGEDVGRIRQGIEAMTRAAMRIAEAAQRSAQAGAGGGPPGAADDQVVDAEFEDVDDPKRRAS
jgi:molecular chaperone DnaK